jgi:hypothetical protein
VLSGCFVRFAEKVKSLSWPKCLFLLMAAKFPLKKLIKLGWQFAFLVSPLSVVTSYRGGPWWKPAAALLSKSF